MEEIKKPFSTSSNVQEESDFFRETPFFYEPEKRKEPLLPRIISIALHPLFMGVYGVILLFIYTNFNILFAGQFIRFIIPVFLLSCLIPASSIYFFKRAGVISDYTLKNKNERLIPFIAAFCSYSLLIYYFASAGMYSWFIGMLTAPLVLIIITSIITCFWKISTHMIGIGGLIGSILSVCYNVKGLNPFILFMVLFILAGLLGVSRLILQRHTPAQVYTGFSLGLVVSYICVLIGAYWGVIMLLKDL